MIIAEEEVVKNLLNKLAQKAENSVLIVEGKNDRKALEYLGINCDVFLLNGKGSLNESAEIISNQYDHAILLLDADKKGRELTNKMKSYLQKLGVKTDIHMGRKLLGVAQSSTVEGLKHIL